MQVHQRWLRDAVSCRASMFRAGVQDVVIVSFIATTRTANVIVGVAGRIAIFFIVSCVKTSGFGLVVGVSRAYVVLDKEA